MKKILSLTAPALLGAALLASCNPINDPIGNAFTGTLKGKVHIGTTVTGDPSTLPDSAAAGGKVQARLASVDSIFGDLSDETATPLSLPGGLRAQAITVTPTVLATGNIDSALNYSLTLPEPTNEQLTSGGLPGSLGTQGNPTCTLLSTTPLGGRAAAASLEVVTPAGATVKTTLDSTVNFNTTGQIAGVTARTAIYSERAGRDVMSMKCNVSSYGGVGTLTFDSDLNLRRGWNIVNADWRIISASQTTVTIRVDNTLPRDIIQLK